MDMYDSLKKKITEKRIIDQDLEQRIKELREKTRSKLETIEDKYQLPKGE